MTRSTRVGAQQRPRIETEEATFHGAPRSALVATFAFRLGKVRPEARVQRLPHFLFPKVRPFLYTRCRVFRNIAMKTNASAMPLVGILMGSDSDWPTMKAAADLCAEFRVPCEAKVISAHRTPKDLENYASAAAGRGLRVIIAGAGGAAHLPGVTAAFTTLPVIGVPIESKSLKGLDSLLSIVQMPPGVPVATVGIGAAKNAGLLALQILATSDAKLRKALSGFKERLAVESRAKNQTIRLDR
jgi:5-(carboxyamino)imidazole ribonucleotide mutase